MSQKKIKVLFFSKIFAVSQAVTSLFTNEVDFSYRELVSLDELNELKQEELESIIILDLSDSAIDFDSIIYRKKVNFLSSSFIFILNNEEIIDSVLEKNFSSYKTMSKPFRIDELFSAIRVLATKFRQFDEPLILLRGNSFDPRKNEIRKFNGNFVRLTEKETELINFLHKGQGRTISKDILLKGIWGYKETISTHTLETHIYRLRKKIELGLGETDLIMKNNKGYYLNVSYSIKS